MHHETRHFSIATCDQSRNAVIKHSRETMNLSDQITFAFLEFLFPAE